MKVFHRMIHPAVSFPRSSPLHNCSCVSPGRISHIMSTGSSVRLSNAKEETPSVVEKEGTSPLGGSELATKLPSLFREMIGPICRDMSPQEAFEFRLQSRIDYRHVPYCKNVTPALVEKGLAYHITDADWLSPDGEEVRKLVEDDDRYSVDWGNLAPDKMNGTTVVFMPFLPLPHMLNEKEEDSSISDPLGPSDPIVLEKAWSRFNKAQNACEEIQQDLDSQIADIRVDFYDHIGELCALMSPKDSFVFRLKTRSSFTGNVDDINFDPEENDWGLRYSVGSSEYYEFGSSFKEFVEDDNRYEVDWGEMYCEMCHWRGNSWVGTIDFMPLDNDEDD